jgi:hypothetical protein
MISLTSNIAKTDSYNILIEIIDAESEHFYKNLGFPNEIFISIENHQKDKKNK